MPEVENMIIHGEVGGRRRDPTKASSTSNAGVESEQGSNA